MPIGLWIGLSGLLYFMIGAAHCLLAYTLTEDDIWIDAVPLLLWPIAVWIMLMDVGKIYIKRRKAEKLRGGRDETM